jgi:diguanylate cyclase (GGDEF)-like protein
MLKGRSIWSPALGAPLRTRHDVKLKVFTVTAIALSIALPATFAITFWRFGGDLSQTASGWSMLRFALGVTLAECGTVCPMLAYRGYARMREINRLRDRLQALAAQDPLTGVLNRRGFDEAVAALAPGVALAIVICDIDHFKRVNDRFGHAVGDLVLQKVAETLTNRAQSHPAALLARFGGEEFVVALPGADLHEARAWAEKTRDLLGGARAPGPEGPIAVTASFGVAAAAHFDADVAALIARADAALYGAKNGGRNRVATEGDAPRASRAA